MKLSDFLKLQSVEIIKSTTIITQQQFDAKQDRNEKNTPNGYAGLDLEGKILENLLPEDSGMIPIFVVNNYSIQKNEIALVDTTNSSITIIFPNLPENGDMFKIVDIKKNSEINNIIVDGNGNTIDNKSENLIINYNGYSLLFVYDNGNYHIIDNLYHY